MDKYIHKASQALSWVTALDMQNKLILLGGFLALMWLLNWLWKRGLDRESRPKTRRSGPRIILAPKQRVALPDEDFTRYNDVSYSPQPLMSRTELDFWSLLYKAVPGHHIFPQVATSALLNAASPNSDHFRVVLRAFSTTRIDFVICDNTLKVVALVELDDKSHDDKREKDRRRDFITAQAGYKTVRFDCRQWPDVEEVRKKILG